MSGGAGPRHTGGIWDGDLGQSTQPTNCFGSSRKQANRSFETQIQGLSSPHSNGNLLPILSLSFHLQNRGGNIRPLMEMLRGAERPRGRGGALLHVMGCPGPVGTESRWGEATVPVLLGWSRAVAVTTLMNSACSGWVDRAGTWMSEPPALPRLSSPGDPEGCLVALNPL